MNPPDRTPSAPDRRRFLRLVGALGLAGVNAGPQAATAAEPPSPRVAPAPESPLRLPNIPPDRVSAEQRPLFDRLRAGIQEHLQGFVTQKPDGSLIGPFNALLHFPRLGTPRGASSWRWRAARPCPRRCAKR